MAVVPLSVLEGNKKGVVDDWYPLKNKLSFKTNTAKGTLKKMVGGSEKASGFLNADGNRGMVRVVLQRQGGGLEKSTSSTAVGSPLSSGGLKPEKSGIGKESRDELMRTAVTKFRDLAESSAMDNTWSIPPADLVVGSQLAEGTNAIVCKGSYRGQQVAIKVLKQALDERQMKDFTHEFEMLSKLRSPYIILFYGASINEETMKLSMVFEFCNNGSLQGVLRKEPLDWNRFFRFSIQAVLGIASLHNWTPCILHRDVKSLNFLVDSFYNIKVADLGLARADEGDNESTLKSLRGTFHYSPPESYTKDETFEAKSDVFSLAIVLWEMLVRVICGQYVIPYSERKFKMDFAIIIAVTKENIRPYMPVKTPVILKDLIEKCWHREKAQRLSSTEFAEALHNLQLIYKQNKEEWDAAVGAEEYPTSLPPAAPTQ